MKSTKSLGLQAEIVKKLDFFTISLSLNCLPGETVLLTGPSGSGKTTILRCLAGLERLDSGCIGWNGVIWDAGPSGKYTKPRHRTLGFLTQDYGLFPHMTVLENIRFAMRGQEDPEDCLATLGLWHLRQKRPHEISGGERQRAALCQSLASKPQLLLLDEPFSALDIENRTLLHRCLAREQEENDLAVVHVTHDLSEILNGRARIVALDRGREAPQWLARVETDLARSLRQGRRRTVSRPASTHLKSMEEDLC